MHEVSENLFPIVGLCILKRKIKTKRVQWAFITNNLIVHKKRQVQMCSIFNLIEKKTAWPVRTLTAAAAMWWWKEVKNSPAAACCSCTLPLWSLCFPRALLRISSGDSTLWWWRHPRRGWYAGRSIHQAETVQLHNSRMHGLWPDWQF